MVIFLGGGPFLFLGGPFGDDRFADDGDDDDDDDSKRVNEDISADDDDDDLGTNDG